MIAVGRDAADSFERQQIQEKAMGHKSVCGMESRMEDGMNIVEIVKTAQEKGASDIHIICGMPVMLRVDGRLLRMSEEVVLPDMTEKLAAFFLTEAQQERLAQQGEVDFVHAIPEICRLRVNICRQQKNYALAIRLLLPEVPAWETLFIPSSVVRLTAEKRGLVLIAGTKGSGKSTTAASMLRELAENEEKFILTLEQSVEYLYPAGKALIMQREIGTDSQSYAHALRAAMRQDADVLMVGELADSETISMALAAAENGHLVLAMMHADSQTAVERMVEVFPVQCQQQVRAQLADVLRGISVQQLLPRQDGAGRIAAFEVLLANEAVGNLIREGKSSQLPVVLETCRADGMQSMDDAVYELYMKSQIDSDTAVSYARDSSGMQQKVQLF